MHSSPSQSAQVTSRLLRLRPLAVCVACALASRAYAGPTGGAVVGGGANITQRGAVTDIRQTTGRAIVDWQSFNIGVSETVNFNQPGASSVILNRVTGAQPSDILGRMNANGIVALVNPNGVYFGRGAQVNVGGLIATTANTANSDFMNGRLDFLQPGRPGAQVRNEGTINVGVGGLAAFVAPSVRNDGVINARMGKIALSGAPAFTVDLYGDQLVNLVVPPSTLQNVVDETGKPLAHIVANTGNIEADGGWVQLSAASASSLVASVISSSGVIRARSATQEGGVVRLEGGDNVTLAIDGGIDSRTVRASAETVSFGTNARIDAGLGGNVQIGGGLQGSGPLYRSSSTVIANGARIDAPAGDVVVWSNGRTSFSGSIAAPSGFVEVSGKQTLNYAGKVTAAKLLLDPRYIVVEAGSDPINPQDSGAKDDVIGASILNNLLRAGTSVNLIASDSVYLNAPIDGRTGSTQPGGGLQVQAELGSVYLNNHIVTNSSDINIRAGDKIVMATNTSIDAGTGKVLMRSANDVAVQRLVGGTIDLQSTAGSLTLGQPLGGNDLSNPEVGVVRLAALKNVELNGINARGQTGGTLPGFTVGAGGTITSNEKISIADGPIVLGNAQTTKLILKDSIYSRGGYAISVHAPVSLQLGASLQNCFASGAAGCSITLADVLPQYLDANGINWASPLPPAAFVKVPKIEIGNNAASATTVSGRDQSIQFFSTITSSPNVVLVVDGLGQIQSSPAFIQGNLQKVPLGSPPLAYTQATLEQVFGTYYEGTINSWRFYSGPHALYSRWTDAAPPPSPSIPGGVNPKPTGTAASSVLPDTQVSNPQVEFGPIGGAIIGQAPIPTLDIVIPAPSTPTVSTPTIPTTPTPTSTVSTPTIPTTPTPTSTVSTPTTPTTSTAPTVPLEPVIPGTGVGNKPGTLSETAIAASNTSLNIVTSESTEKLQRSSGLLNNESAENDWIEEPTNAARRADLGLSDAKRGAAPDVFRTKFCIVSPGNTSAGNQKFFMECRK